jgi:hypothetical protein
MEGIMAHFGSGPAARPNFTHTPQAGPTQPAPERVNAYGAKCADCGVWVEPGQGRLIRGNGGWRVSHIPPCPDPQSQHEPVNKPVVEAAPAVAFSVPDGRYTVQWENEYKTIRVSHQGEFDTFMPGRVLIGFLSGSDNDHDYTSFAHVDESGSVRIWKKHRDNHTLLEAVKVILGDPRAASKAYAQESGCCGVCGRTLTTPESLAAGIGPVCAEKTGF